MLLRAAVTTALLCCALRGASAVTYGQPGVGSQYQLFGGPSTDTAIHRVIPIRSGADTAFALATEGDAQQKATAPAAAEASKPAHACDSGFIFSDVFNKCLPAPGKDGYIGKAPYDEQIKGKGATESRAFAPISVQTFAPMMPLRTAPLTGAPNERSPQSHSQPQPQPQPQPRGDGQTSPRGRAIVAPTRQLRLACPPGFGFEPAMGACIAPAAALQQQAMPMRMNRPRVGEEEEDDDSDYALRRGRQHMFGRRFRSHSLGRRFGFGGARILAPVFVFVLPPSDANTTSRFGLGFEGRNRQQRIHEIHPSMVGPIGRPTSATTPAASAPATAEKPIGPETTPKVVEGERKPGPKGTAGTDTSALRGAFVNPIVGSGKSLPLKSHSATDRDGIRIRGDDDSTIRSDVKQDLPRMRMLKRHAFVSPLIESRAHGAGAGANSEAA